MQKARGPQRAIRDLQALYADKYTPLQKNDSDLVRAILQVHVTNQSPPLSSIPADKVTHALSLCKTGKSCGTDGVPYEPLRCIMQTDLKFEFVEMYNSILNGSFPTPDN